MHSATSGPQSISSIVPGLGGGTRWPCATGLPEAWRSLAAAGAGEASGAGAGLGAGDALARGGAPASRIHVSPSLHSSRPRSSSFAWNVSPSVWMETSPPLSRSRCTGEPSAHASRLPWMDATKVPSSVTHRPSSPGALLSAATGVLALAVTGGLQRGTMRLRRRCFLDHWACARAASASCGIASRTSMFPAGPESRTSRSEMSR
mmetsp:Transcript_7429/g.23348  ORF Transcript_7429/g.23348 Transcript_7429/m.23348 type:complete len:205 (+) Transcript_7429:73-687(+)